MQRRFLSSTSSLLHSAPQVLADKLGPGGRVSFVRTPNALITCTRPELETELQSLGEWIRTSSPDYDDHEAIFIASSPQTNTLMSASIYNTTRGQGAGGVRCWSYSSLDQFLTDGLRLSIGMAMKNALAGIWWGGAKGGIAIDATRKNDTLYRQKLFQDYGAFITSLKGCYVTAEDVGVTPLDMQQIFTQTRFSTCIPEIIGGSGNPSLPTSRGVIAAMQGALQYVHGSDSFEKRTLAVQGCGHVAQGVIQQALEKGVQRVIACDVQEETLDKVRQFPWSNDSRLELRKVDAQEDWILREKVDILSPCALGAVLNHSTIPKIQARIVCGAANNQLKELEKDDRLLFEQGIVYVPDFLANRMGIVTCADEQYGYVAEDSCISRHFSKDWKNAIFPLTLDVLQYAEEKQIPTSQAAGELAKTQMKQDHPIWPQRSRQIISSLIDTDQWHLHNQEMN